MKQNEISTKVEWTYGVHPVAIKFSNLGAKTITNHGEMWTFSGDLVYAVNSFYFCTYLNFITFSYLEKYLISMPDRQTH